jgi:hypothetical protein
MDQPPRRATLAIGGYSLDHFLSRIAALIALMDRRDRRLQEDARFRQIDSIFGETGRHMEEAQGLVADAHRLRREVGDGGIDILLRSADGDPMGSRKGLLVPHASDGRPA